MKRIRKLSVDFFKARNFNVNVTAEQTNKNNSKPSSTKVKGLFKITKNGSCMFTKISWIVFILDVLK